MLQLATQLVALLPGVLSTDKGAHAWEATPILPAGRPWRRRHRRRRRRFQETVKFSKQMLSDPGYHKPAPLSIQPLLEIKWIFHEKFILFLYRTTRFTIYHWNLFKTDQQINAFVHEEVNRAESTIIPSIFI